MPWKQDWLGGGGAWAYYEAPETTFREICEGLKAAADTVDEVLPILLDGLDIDTMRVRWFLPDDQATKVDRCGLSTTFVAAPTIRGRCLGANPTEVWLRADQAIEPTVETLAHELKHAKTFLESAEGKRRLPPVDEDERVASEYGQKILREFLGVAA